SFSFNTAPLITKMTYIPSQDKVRLILAVENSQKLDFSNQRATVKYKKLQNKTDAYGWEDPTSNSGTNSEASATIETIQVSQPQNNNEENFGITFLEFELGNLEKGSWYLIEEISLSTKDGSSTSLSLYLDKEKMQPDNKKTSTSESEKWQTIVNTTIESTTI
ncbi:hypothetical protein, partial [Mesomycoplasma ovipneumoniae]